MSAVDIDAVAESLPETPLPTTFLDDLEDQDDVAGVVGNTFLGFSFRRDLVTTFGVALDSGVIAALGFDPADGRWVVVDRERPTQYDDRDAATDRVEASCWDWIGHEEEYEYRCLAILTESDGDADA